MFDWTSYRLPSAEAAPPPAVPVVQAESAVTVLPVPCDEEPEYTTSAGILPDPRFMIDLETTHGLREKLAQVSLWFRQESATRVHWRKRRIEVLYDRDHAKRALKKFRDQCFLSAKAGAEKVTDKAAEALVDANPAVEPYVATLDKAEKELDLIQVHIEEAEQNMESIKLLHKSLVALVGDVADERRFA